MKAAGGLAAAALALALLTSCASRPLATPTATVVAPTATPTPAPTRPPPTATPRLTATPTIAPPTATATPRPLPTLPPTATRGVAPTSPAPGAALGQPPRKLPSPAAGRPRAPEPGAGRVPLTAADGFVADGEGLSPFAADHPAVGKLAPELLAAVRRASTDAARDGVELIITSGWRSARYQQALLDAAIAHHGSEAEARKWVSTPEKSAHVTGEAVDVGPTDAALWLSQRGSRYGLCQIYANEIWHYELATRPGGVCPRPIPDASAG